MEGGREGGREGEREGVSVFMCRNNISIVCHCSIYYFHELKRIIYHSAAAFT